MVKYSDNMFIRFDRIHEHSALPAPIAWKDLISNFPPSAAELFRLSPHRSGTHYQTQSFRHQHSGRSSTNWKLFYFNYPLFITTVIAVCSNIRYFGHSNPFLIDWLIDGHTDRHTPHDDIGRACIASRGKNRTVFATVMIKWKRVQFFWLTVYIKSSQEFLFDQSCFIILYR